VWEAATGRLVHTLPGKRSSSWSVAFSPDGKTLATGWGWGEIRLYDMATGWEVADLRVGVGDVRWLGFHPDGRSLGYVGTAAESVVTHGIWDLATRKEVRRMSGPHQLGGALRADGLLMVSCGDSDGTVRLWSADDKPLREQAIRLFPPGTSWLHGMAMSPEGRHVATANPDGTVTILRLAKPGDVFEP
jgi:WD40 repeat protein